MLKTVNRMLLRWKLFIKIFIKFVADRHSKWKVFQKKTNKLKNDPKNGLNLIFLLPICSFTLAFVVGEGGSFDVDYSSLTFILGPKGLLCQECDIH